LVQNNRSQCTSSTLGKYTTRFKIIGHSVLLPVMYSVLGLYEEESN
jgi:hypothetical protein